MDAGWISRGKGKAMIRRVLSSPVIACVFRIFLGAIFLYAGLIKILDPSGFARNLIAYQVLPPIFISIAAMTLPTVEVLTGINLLLGVWIDGSALLASGLLGIFFVALLLSLIRGLDISCGCFSTAPGTDTIKWSFLVRDILLMAMALYVVFFDQKYGTVRYMIRFVRFSRSRKEDP